MKIELEIETDAKFEIIKAGIMWRLGRGLNIKNIKLQEEKEEK